MRAGAREFVTDPLSPNAVAEALIRASVRRDEMKRQKKTGGKVLVFTGAKGGSGVTTVASNFAVALAKEAGAGVALVDLNLPLGDVALQLGLSHELSMLDALRNSNRLDSDFLSKLLVRHSSGLQVLVGPDRHSGFQPDPESVLRLLRILRNDFAYVVVDGGSHLAGYGEQVFDLADKVYLVTQASVAELRNSHRIVSELFEGERQRKLEVVLNRYSARAGELDEQSIEKALKTTPNWKVPSDFLAVRRAQDAGAELVAKDGVISRVITGMAKAACGKTASDGKKRRFGLF
jgi:pilus assembly protein CpaE